MESAVYNQTTEPTIDPSRLQKICFFFNAQLHHVFHAMPLAVEMSHDPRFAVEVVAMTDAHIELARDVACRQGAGAIRFVKVEGRVLSAITAIAGGSTPPKLAALAAARSLLKTYDAIVVPERTSLLLRHFGLRGTRFIHTCHGAGDRAVGYDRRIRHFDFVLLAGEKQHRRMLEKGLIREGHYEVAGYGKFDLTAGRVPERLFPQDRPIVLYNPHFSKHLSSWPKMGLDIIRQFAADDRFNLIVAPHIRMFDNTRARARMERELAPFAKLDHVHIDLGSPASVDMRYADAAAVYLGDVSSQIYEFVVRPRPCLFLDSHQADWRTNPNYRHWQYGPVHDSSEGIVDKVAQAIASHPDYAPTQRQGVEDTFEVQDVKPSRKAAKAVGDFLAHARPGVLVDRPSNSDLAKRNALVHE